MKQKIISVICICFLFGCSSTGKSGDGKRDVAATAPSEVVVTYHPIATQIGSDVLHHGGNAFDAFVAATAAEYVLGEGVTSLAGPLGALLYHAKSNTSEYMDACFNQPLDPRQKWNSKNPSPGTAALVPGAVAGLEAISKKFGNLSFEAALSPAVKLAEEGFPLSPLYAALIKSQDYGVLLKNSDYGRKTYFREDGTPLQTGDILKLPIVAEFLRNVTKHGSDYVYKGKWAKDALNKVNSQGGHLTEQDFSGYKVKWNKPWKISYRGYEIYSPQIKGGLNSLLSLKVFEHVDVAKSGGHYSSSAEALETLVRVQDEVDGESWQDDPEKTDNSKFLESVFSQSHIEKIWSLVQQKIQSPPTSNTGSHSYHIVIVDHEGNAVTGTNTIESFPWGNGIFVEGIPLTASGMLPFDSKPGQRRRSPLSMQIGTRDGKLKFATGAFSASLVPAAFQFVVNIVDYKLSAKETVTLPRFGSQAWDIHTLKSVGGRWLDPRISKTIVDDLEKKGFKFIQSGYMDTGLGSVAIVQDDGSVEGAFAPLSTIGYTPGFNH